MIGYGAAGDLIVSAILDSLKGRFDIDLQEEHIFFHHGYAKKMHIPAGNVVGQHVHNRDHESAYSGGPVRIRTDTYTEILPAGCGSFTIKAGVAHQVEALGKVDWYCIWDTDETNPTKIDESVIEV
jgi:hypothetical protein